MKSGSPSSPSLSKLLRLTNAMYRPATLRIQTRRTVTEVDTIIVGIHHETGTVLLQDAGGDLYDHVPPWSWANRDREGHSWHWPGADAPTNPETFSPTHTPKPPKAG